MRLVPLLYSILSILLLPSCSDDDKEGGINECVSDRNIIFSINIADFCNPRYYSYILTYHR